MRRLIENKGLRTCQPVGKRIAARLGLRRDETHERKARAVEAGPGKRRHDGGGAGNGNDAEPCLANGLDRTGARIGHAGRARIGNERHLFAFLKKLDDLLGTMPFVVLPNRQKFYTNAKFIQKLAGFACILSGDNISQSEYPERPQCNISKIADRQPDDVKRAVGAVLPRQARRLNQSVRCP